MVLILKSIPIVVMKDGVNESSLKRSRQHDLPTPESPMSSSLICVGKGFGQREGSSVRQHVNLGQRASQS